MTELLIYRASSHPRRPRQQSLQLFALLLFFVLQSVLFNPTASLISPPAGGGKKNTSPPTPVPSPHSSLWENGSGNNLLHTRVSALPVAASSSLLIAFDGLCCSVSCERGLPRGATLISGLAAFVLRCTRDTHANRNEPAGLPGGRMEGETNGDSLRRSPGH